MPNNGKGLQIIKELTKPFKGKKKFNRTLDKVAIICAENGKCCAEFTVQEEHTNARGTMHGGMSATLVDMISTFAIMTIKEVPGVSVDLHITFLKAAKVGEEVLVEANTVRAGRTLAFLNVVIKNKNTGDIYVTGLHTKFIAV